VILRAAGAVLGILGGACGFIFARSLLLALARSSHPQATLFLVAAAGIGVVWGLLGQIGLLARRNADRKFGAAGWGREIGTFLAMAVVLLLLSPTVVPIRFYRDVLAVVADMGLGLAYELALPPVLLLERVAPALVLISARRVWWQRRWFAHWRLSPLTIVLLLFFLVLVVVQPIGLQGLVACATWRALTVGYVRGWWLGVIGFGKLALLVHVAVYLLGAVIHFGLGSQIPTATPLALSALMLMTALGFVAIIVWPMVEREPRHESPLPTLYL